MRALVLFGSESDRPVYDELVRFLENGFEVDFEVISAHRNPEKLSKRLRRDDFDFVVAGAGLAAHLPGVCASLTKRPVFGLPVAAQLGGMDSMLSILQMPFGVPVATMSLHKWSDLFLFIESIKKANNLINVVTNKADCDYYQREFDRLKKHADLSGLPVTQSDYRSDAINIVMVTEKKHICPELPAFHIPLLDDQKKKDPESCLKLLEWVNQGGFWLGVNNSRNALLFSQKMRGL